MIRMRFIQLVVLLVSFIFASCAPHPFPNDEQRAHLNSGASSLVKQRKAWLAKAPRKFTEMNVPRKNLPTSLQGMGFAEATVSDSYVILPKEHNLGHGVLVFTGPPKPLPFLEEIGVKITDTAYPEIKTLEMDLKAVR
jgi:hypothetical protein